ncbi:MAG TPA: LPS export ABC transporter periplasmic protein LptC [Bacteroidia bacterium]
MDRGYLLLRFCLYTLYLIPFFFLTSCENDIRKIKLISSPEKLPVETDKDVELVYTDSAKMKLKLKAPELDHYQGVENYIELPKGVALTFFNDSGKVKSTLTANYARRNLDNGRMEARNNVVVVNERGDKLQTEHLVYDEHAKYEISTEANVTITTVTDTLYGKGLQSNADFTRWKILNPVAKTIVENDSLNTQEK